MVLSRLSFPRLTLAMMIVPLLALTSPSAAQPWRVADTPLRALMHTSTSTSTHFLYVDNGALGDAQQTGGVGMRLDSISGYQITPGGLIPTPGSPYPTPGFQNSIYGANSLATSLANGPCVFHTDGGSGQVESFSVAANGSLSLVSTITVGTLLGTADDIHVSADGRYVYVALWNSLGPSYLDVFTVGSGCSLTLASTTQRANAVYYSIALISSTQLMAIDFLNSRIDIYQITNGTRLSLLTSTQSQLLGPSGAAAAQIGTRTYIFNGISTLLPGEAEAHTVNSQGILGLVPGSPQIDIKSLDGAYVFFDRSHQQLIESEQLSNSLGVYGLRLGLFALLGHTALPGGNVPVALTELGSELFVINALSGIVDACAIGTGSLKCVWAATLSIFELPDGIGVL
jgi:hypothetical protein